MSTGRQSAPLDSDEHIMLAGGCRFIGGRLVPASIDAYLCMEYANGGDLFDLRGQLAAAEVGEDRRKLAIIK